MIFQDPEFGEVIIRKNALSRNLKFSISTSGRLQISAPQYVSERFIKHALNTNRANIRRNLPVNNPETQRARDYRKKQLTKQAKEYLPYRLEYFAKRYNYHYDKLRFSHANTRWGSCSSNRTISLNIGLMKLPESLRDYVIIHELAHLNHMNHSQAFWAEVALHDHNYKIHEKKLKNFAPGV